MARRGSPCVDHAMRELGFDERESCCRGCSIRAPRCALPWSPWTGSRATRLASRAEAPVSRCSASGTFGRLPLPYRDRPGARLRGHLPEARPLWARTPAPPAFSGQKRRTRCSPSSRKSLPCASLRTTTGESQLSFLVLIQASTSSNCPPLLFVESAGSRACRE